MGSPDFFSEAPVLKLYRRHRPACKHADKGSSYAKCSCPIWVDGMLDGKRVRYSLDLFNWEDASKRLLEISAKDEKKDSTVTEAAKSFLEDCESRQLGAAGIGKYRETLEAFKMYCAGRAITSVRAVDFPATKKFIDELDDSSLTKGKKIERLRTFFRYCEDMEWCDFNPALKIKKPKVMNKPVVPFTSHELKAIFAAIEKYPSKNSFGYDNQARMRAFLLTLRYVGLRISDAVKLEKSKVNDGRLLIRTMKTGATVHLPIPPILRDALKAIPGDGAYYFWSGNGLLKSAVADWQRSLIRLFSLAGIKGHPHMFRHTMAVELLEKGVTVEQVAAILGNSPAIVYKHYAPWVASRQRALDDAVKKAWA
jgi:site-specific recombinase XerD